MELVRRYSNCSDLQERLQQARLRAGERVSKQQEPDDGSVRGRAAVVWRVRDRLSDDDIAEIIERFQAGTAKRVLAAQYELSVSSVKSLLRQRGVRRTS